MTIDEYAAWAATIAKVDEHPSNERLSYLGSGSQPAEVSSVAALAKTVYEPRVVEVCEAAIRTLDGKASGVFSVDLKENAAGTPCVTEINAGRFSSATNIFDLTGKHNMAVTYVRLAQGERLEVGEVGGDPPRDVTVVADHPVVGDRSDERDARRHGVRPHAAGFIPRSAP